MENGKMKMPLEIQFTHFDDYTTPETKTHWLHAHDSVCELYLFLRGDCEFMVENGVFPLSLGSVIFTRPGELHGVRVLRACRYARAYFQMPPDALDFLTPSPMRCFTDRPFGQDNTIQLEAGAAARCAAELMRIEAASGTPDAASVSLSALLTILAEVNAARRVAPERATDSTLITQALRCVNENLASIRSVGDLAARLYVSREHLSRLFSRSVQVTAGEYLTRKRVERAKELLRQGLGLEEVCARCGWSDESYFISVFRRELGVTPAQYRREYARRT